MVEPLVWLPIASGTISAPTAAAEPLDEPPGVCSGLRGLRVLPGKNRQTRANCFADDHRAGRAQQRNDSRVARRRASGEIGEPYSVGMSAVSKISF